jgi:hypothetical protein
VRKYVKPKPISRQNQKLTQQHNWKKSSSSPHAVSVLVLLELVIVFVPIVLQDPYNNIVDFASFGWLAKNQN